MNKDSGSDTIIRRPKSYISSLSTNHIHLRNPSMTVWMSVLFPGFGHVLLGSYFKGFLLIIWEIIVNMNAKINLAIIYTFQGKFELAKDALDKRWVFLYLGVFSYALWDSYRLTVDLNKLSVLADRQAPPIVSSKIDCFGINYLDKRSPWVAAIWSAMMPGMGQNYTNRLPIGFFLLVWWIAIAYYSRYGEALYYSIIGAFEQAKAIVDPQWLLFMPSLHFFAVYDAYVHTVEFNKLFALEQAGYLKGNYQSETFELPCNGGVIR